MLYVLCGSHLVLAKYWKSNQNRMVAQGLVLCSGVHDPFNSYASLVCNSDFKKWFRLVNSYESSVLVHVMWFTSDHHSFPFKKVKLIMLFNKHICFPCPFLCSPPFTRESMVSYMEFWVFQHPTSPIPAFHLPQKSFAASCDKGKKGYGGIWSNMLTNKSG